MAVYYNHNVQFENGPFGLGYPWIPVPQGPPQDSNVYTAEPAGTTQPQSIPQVAIQSVSLYRFCQSSVPQKQEGLPSAHSMRHFSENDNNS